VDEDEDGRSVACNHLASMTPAPGAPVAYRILRGRRQQTAGQAKRRNATWMSVGRSGATELVDEVSPPASPTSGFRAGEPLGSRALLCRLSRRRRAWNETLITPFAVVQAPDQIYCHIAEHHESGMMFSFNVAP
jgi:hypothetical protein